MAEEFRVFGPPGTGKTTNLTEWAQRGVEVFGASQVSVCSLTRAAVREAAGRDLGLADESVTTLHARCKRALNAGPPAEERIEDFLRDKPGWVGETPRKQLHKKPEDDEEGETAPESRLSGRGDLAFNRMVLYRQQLLPKEKWDRTARDLHTDWSLWCAQNGTMDYTGWLEACQDGGILPPQQVVLVDEAQDHTPLQMRVLRNWQTKRLALFGDDDQSLYEWSGAKPEEFFLPELPKGKERVLAQSYRVPRAVHRVAARVSARIRTRREKEYLPRGEEGEVAVLQAPWVGAPPWRGMSEADQRRYAEEHKEAIRDTLLPQISPTGRTMILSTCGYHLDPILSELRAWKVSYHNPYRRTNTKWNPLGVALETLTAFQDGTRGLRRENISLWAGRVRKDVFFKASKRRLDEVLQGSGELLPAEVAGIFTEEGERLARRGDLNEFMGSLPLVQSLRWDEALRVLRRGGMRPDIIVGTIHSVKGGEADTVIVLPYLSPAGAADWDAQSDRVFRLIYVAVTRARQRLVLIQDPSGGPQISWEGLV